jgi:hypothetical protein
LRTPKPELRPTDEAIAVKLRGLLDGVQGRRDVLRLMGAGLGYSALGSILPGCGGSGGGGGGSGGGGGTAPTSQPALPAASTEYTVLKRTSFGVHRDALSAIRSQGIDAYLDTQLNYQAINDGALESTIATLFPLTAGSPAELMVEFPSKTADMAQQMISATQYRQIFSKRQLYEVMVEFWTNHFNIHLLNGLGPTLKPEDDRQVIRAHALGNFRALLGASARSPAMLFYLDNFYNQAAAPNENYARELMELHTLGVDGGYTEQDVKEVARCLTGWSLRFPGDASGAYGSYTFISAVHDNGTKTVLNQSITVGGQGDGDRVLDVLAAHPSTARFIATKLCRRFISDTPDPAAVSIVAAAFTVSNGDIKATLRALFGTSAFRNSADLKFCRPTEYLAGIVRALAPDTAYPTDSGVLFFIAQSVLGQLPFYWSTPDGYPDKQDYWANTGGLLNRWRMSFLSYAPYIPGIGVFQINYTNLLGGANTITTVIDALVANVLMRPLVPADRTILINWIVAKNITAADAVLPPGIPEQIAALVAAVLVSSSYFQLR